MNLTRNGVTIQVADDLAFRLVMERLAAGDAINAGAAIGDTVRPVGCFASGTYMGLTLHDNAPMKLILLPGDVEKTWSDAQAWAAEQGGVLPSRFDALVLFQHHRERFQKAAYWTDAPLVDDEGYAWYQYFVNTADADSIRGRLGDFYARWRARFDPAVWMLLEEAAGGLPG